MPRLVALCMPGGPRFVDEVRRAWDGGDAVLPVDVRLPPAAQADLVERMGAGILVTEDGSRTVSRSGRPVEDGDAVVIATSGTTGAPKGAVHTFDGLRASARITHAALGAGPEDHWLSCLPVAHVGAFAVVARAVLDDLALTVLPAFAAGAVLDAAQRGATLTALVPTALARVEVAMFRAVVLGGAPPLASLPPNVVASYGMTETFGGVVYDGLPLPDVEVRVTDGVVEVRTPTLLRCYRDGRDPKTADGWLATGDAGAIEDGALRLHGRVADVINTGGEKVWPVAVEHAVRSHPTVAEVLVHGETDPEWGQRVVASIELHPGAPTPTLPTIREHVKRLLPAYAAPRELRIVDELRRTGSGKLVRRPATS